jgi:hypothetical protein
MQISRSIYVLPLVLACSPTLGQSTAEPKSPTPSASALAQEAAAKIKEANAKIAEWQKTCRADWDAQTHMTKAEWTATCRRVSTERGKFLLDETSKATFPSQIFPSQLIRLLARELASTDFHSLRAHGWTR